MAHDDKEKAKEVLGFRGVPFYVVLDERGCITQMGKKVDWDALLQLLGQEDLQENGNEKENDRRQSSAVPRNPLVNRLAANVDEATAAVVTPNKQESAVGKCSDDVQGNKDEIRDSVPEERTFVLEDLDF